MNFFWCLQATEIVNKAKAENVLIKQIKNKGFNQDNVVLILSAPADQKVDDSIVVVGGHLDSTTGGDRNGRAPGADDGDFYFQLLFFFVE